MNRIRIAVVSAAALLMAARVAAADEPLDVGALQACAAQVQQLRSGASRLTEQVQRSDARRSELNAQGAALQREAGGSDRDNLQAHLDLQQRRQQHNDAANAFNSQMVAQRQAIDDLNRVKADYERNCSSRSYRRSDFAALSPDAQAAMRAGLDDISVPYVDPTLVR